MFATHQQRDRRRVLQVHVVCAFIAASFAGLAACRTEPTSPPRSVADVASASGDQRISTDASMFSALLREVNYGNRVLISVRAQHSPVLNASELLTLAQAQHWVMLLPHESSDPGYSKRGLGAGGLATRADVDAVSGVLSDHGVTDRNAFHNSAIIEATLPVEEDRLQSILAALQTSGRLDWVEPDEVRTVSPR